MEVLVEIMHGGFSYSTDNFSNDTVMGTASIISDYTGYRDHQ